MPARGLAAERKPRRTGLEATRAERWSFGVSMVVPTRVAKVGLEGEIACTVATSREMSTTDDEPRIPFGASLVFDQGAEERRERGSSEAGG